MVNGQEYGLPGKAPGIMDQWMEAGIELMEIGISTLLFSSHHIVDAVREIARLGHRRIELFCELAGLDVDTVEDATVRRLSDLAEEFRLNYSIHPPLVNTAALDEGERAFRDSPIQGRSGFVRQAGHPRYGDPLRHRPAGR